MEVSSSGLIKWAVLQGEISWLFVEPAHKSKNPIKNRLLWRLTYCKSCKQQGTTNFGINHATLTKLIKTISW